MPTKDLVEKYGGKSSQAINRAIRAELAGGNETLDGLDALHALTRASGSPEAGAALDVLRGVAAAMEALVRRRYGMPPAE
jgi:hypothetical protein